MPANLVVPGVPPEHHHGKGKCVCVMCGYSTTVTNICRECPELPADAELSMDMVPNGRICYHHETPHFIMKNKKRIWTTHRSISMVCVS